MAVFESELVRKSVDFKGMVNSIGNIEIWLGPAAYAYIAKRGLCPNDITKVTGAAGGSKTLCLHGLDQFIFGSWLKNATTQRQHIGASAGSWRMAASLADNPQVALKQCATALAGGMGYEPGWGKEQLETGFRSIISQAIKGSESSIINSKHGLSILASRTEGNLWEPGKGFRPMPAMKMLLDNSISRERLGKHLTRVFHSNYAFDRSFFKSLRDTIAWSNQDMSANRLEDILFWSSSMPIYFHPQVEPEGRWAYLDGGLIDIDLAYPWLNTGTGLHLMPHFHRVLRLGWLDRSRENGSRGRYAPRSWLDKSIIVCPSESFLSILRGGKIPSRQDLRTYKSDKLRFEHWNDCLVKSDLLAEDFSKWLENCDLDRVNIL